MDIGQFVLVLKEMHSICIERRRTVTGRERNGVVRAILHKFAFKLSIWSPSLDCSKPNYTINVLWSVTGVCVGTKCIFTDVMLDNFGLYSSRHE